MRTPADASMRWPRAQFDAASLLDGVRRRRGRVRVRRRLTRVGLARVVLRRIRAALLRRVARLHGAGWEIRAHHVRASIRQCMPATG